MGDEAPSLWQLCGALCSLICCPPIPHRIVAKIAFAPPKSTYRIVGTEDDLVLEYREPFDPSETYQRFAPRDVQRVDVLRFTTRRDSNLAGVFMQVAGATYTLLFSHGNAVGQ